MLQPGLIRRAVFRTSAENNDSIGNRADSNMEIKSMEERIERKLREAEIPGHEVEFDPNEAERIAFREDALSDDDARETFDRLDGKVLAKSGVLGKNRIGEHSMFPES